MARRLSECGAQQQCNLAHFKNAEGRQVGIIRMTITNDEIAWVYRVMLGREASADEFATWGALPSLAELRHASLESVEFRNVLARHGKEADAPTPAQPRLGLDLPRSEVEWKVDPTIQNQLLDHVTPHLDDVGARKTALVGTKFRRLFA